MSVREMWRGGLTIKFLLVFVNLIFFSFGNTTLWICLGLLTLLGAMFMSFQMGQGAGHEACAVTKSLVRVEGQTDKPQTLEPKLFKQAWSRASGVKAIFAGAAFVYIVNAIYIMMTLLKLNETAVMVARVCSWVVTLPYWPIVAHWHDVYTVITPDIAAVLMIAPFILPLCQFAGYMQGPKLWEKTEKAMKDGKRRAKARSRIVKKKTPKARGPEI